MASSEENIERLSNSSHQSEEEENSPDISVKKTEKRETKPKLDPKLEVKPFFLLIQPIKPLENNRTGIDS